MNVIEKNPTDITNEIKEEFVKNECEDIGKKKIWKRNCPKCNKELIYINKRSFDLILKKNSLCSSCCQLNNSHPHTEKHKKYMSKLLKGRNITWKDKIKKNHWSKNPEQRKKFIEEQSKRMCKWIEDGVLNKRNKSFKTGYFINLFTRKKEFYRSSYELKRMNELNNDLKVKMWTTKHKIKIPYFINKIRHYYIPDFLIEWKDKSISIEETKGYIEDKNLFKLKTKAAKKYCLNKNYTYTIIYGNNKT